MRDLADIFAQLGMSQYFGVFVQEGFDSWDTILDITESDLDTLGVKLGHRRKLQRRIADARGLSPNAILPWTPTSQSAEEAKPDSTRLVTTVSGPATSREGTATKRKYRRHPKPDKNAPEKPPSAYVLFSNISNVSVRLEIREDLKGQTLSFTEIAKLVGENWQALPQGERERLEDQAQQAKDRYNQQLAAYKKTAEHRKYSQYLQEFKKKQLQTNQSQAYEFTCTPSLSDMLDNHNRAEDAVSDTYSTGTENQRQPATGFDMMLRTSRASVSSMHLDGSPVSMTSPELQASELVPAKDVGMPIKSLLSTNTTDSMYDLPRCAQTSRKLRHAPATPELTSPQRHAPWRMGDMVGLKVGG
ncbi:unnamed protein product [Parascedosporium putredinis]|uniref:HMG box domain-containing protein n=1 Tax=Parascedosporium putredinis TaxID=1442378 RepID=A0A9P1MCP1_9PEZI|nr:unnamed protein product [Parascedosporium putredinis]CAI7998171.1 unnamed protein product [Parascedosporium putredinis]